MSSLQAAPEAASAPRLVMTVERNEIFSGPVVQIRVNKHARASQFEGEGKVVPYLQFAYSVPGGCINCFVQSSDQALIGQLIKARVTLLERVLFDGRRYYFVDLEPVDEKTPVTHRMSFQKAGPGSWDTDGSTVFETPEPLRGVIIFSPPKATIVAKNTNAIVRPEKKVPKKSATGDSQLDRLIDAGWEIESQDETTVSLMRMKNGEKKTMTHNRPKKPAPKSKVKAKKK